MDFYEQEMRRMFEHNSVLQDMKFCGKTMLGKLDEDLRVKMFLDTTMVAGEYDTIQVAVINRKDGLVDRHRFQFADIIGLQKNNVGKTVKPHIWAVGEKPEWYPEITPTQQAKIADAILDYVGVYQQQNMDMGGMSM